MQDDTHAKCKLYAPAAKDACDMLQGFKTNDKGEKVGYCTMVYSESEVHS